MVRTSIRLLLGAFLLASLHLTGFAQTRMPQLKFTDRTLANGMRVLAAPDRLPALELSRGGLPERAGEPVPDRRMKTREGHF